MSVLHIVAIGPASSVQDRGRFGAQRYGLTPSGAMDLAALATANALVGNDLYAACVEIGPLGATFKANGDASLALAGAARPATIDGRALQWPQSFILKDGETLNLGFARDGAFSYLALGGGGVSGDAVFGSRSVNVRSGLGSPYPRPLQAGDALEVAVVKDSSPQGIDFPAAHERPIRVVFGPQDDEFTDEVRTTFIESEWKISQTSDRMGYRLDGPQITHLHGHNIVSDGTVLGSIQIPGNGAPIVLMPDRGTSGGYPKIATIITADFGRFAQTPAGRPFRFKAVTLGEAQKAAREFAALINSLPGRVQPLRDGALDLDALRSANVAGVAINANDVQSWQSFSTDMTS